MSLGNKDVITVDLGYCVFLVGIDSVKSDFCDIVTMLCLGFFWCMGLFGRLPGLGTALARRVKT